MIFKRAIAKLRAQDWVAITIEVAIVTLGVLIALAAQQWADNRALFPRGVDVVLTCGQFFIALPRTTKIREMEA